jgi:drug/metabolite transporter (DMT)-like permease
MIKQTQNVELKYLLSVAFGAVCISFAPVFVKYLYQQDMSPVAIAFWRTLLGAGVLFGWGLITSRKMILPWVVLKWAIVAGFLFFLDLYAWHHSIIYIGGGMATILGNTQVFATAILGYFLFKEKLSLKYFIAAVSAIFGVVLLVGIGSEIEFTKDYIKGVVFGLLTGLFYAHFIITLKHAGQKKECSGFVCLMAWASLVTAFFFGIALLVFETVYFPPGLQAWMLALGLGITAQAVGWRAISKALPNLPASHSGLLLLLQPVLATLWGYLLFDEYLVVLQLIGAVVTLGAIYFGTISKKKAAK